MRPLVTSNPGRVFENLVILSLPAQGAGYTSTPGDVTAWDVQTGKLKWIFHSIPHPGELGYDTWPKDSYKTAGGVHNWSEFTVDEANGIAFVPFGTARYDFYGGNRPGNNLFANSIVAIDARTGKYLWHQQLVHHDLWDYDLPQAPKLLTIHKDGRAIDVVAQATKHGFLFVFDRKSGKPIWPIEERPVPQSDLPGEHSSPTQPFPTKPAPFAVQSFTEKDINPFLPKDEQDTLRQRLRTSRNEGLFTPPSFQGSIEMPGHNGGANWASSAVDPINGELYVVSKNLPVMLHAQVSNDEPSARSIVGSVVTPEEAAKNLADAKAAAAKGPVRYVVPVRLPAQPDERDGRDWAAVVAPHRVRSEHRRDQVARARRRDARARHAGGFGRALPARRSARDGRRPRVRRDRARPALPRLRPRQRQGALVEGATERLRGHSRDVRGERAAVHRAARRGRAMDCFRRLRSPAPRRNSAATSCSRCRRNSEAGTARAQKRRGRRTASAMRRPSSRGRAGARAI